MELRCACDEEVLRAHRSAGWSVDTIRGVQPFLSRRQERATRSSTSRGARAFRHDTFACRRVRRDRIVMRKITMIGVFLAGLLRLFMSLCGGGFLLTMAIDSLSNIIRAVQSCQ